MGKSRQTLESGIRAAFKRSLQLETETLRDCYLYYCYGGSHGELTSRKYVAKDWSLVDAAYLVENWNGLCYLSLRSFVFYLPSLMIFLLKQHETTQENDMLDLFLFVLYTNLKRARFRELHRKITTPQVLIIKEFLEETMASTIDPMIVESCDKCITLLNKIP